MNMMTKAARRVATTAGAARQAVREQVYVNPAQVSRTRLLERLRHALLHLETHRVCASDTAESRHVLRAYLAAKGVTP